MGGIYSSGPRERRWRGEVRTGDSVRASHARSSRRWGPSGGEVDTMAQIKLAIAGVGNCASSLLQGVEFYRNRPVADSAGLLHPDIGGYRIRDLRVVAAFDIDRRKVGRPL